MPILLFGIQASNFFFYSTHAGGLFTQFSKQDPSVFFSLSLFLTSLLRLETLAGSSRCIHAHMPFFLHMPSVYNGSISKHAKFESAKLLEERESGEEEEEEERERTHFKTIMLIDKYVHVCIGKYWTMPNKYRRNAMSYLWINTSLMTRAEENDDKQ